MNIVVGGPPNLKIEAMYAFVAVGEEGEGIMGGMTMMAGQLVFMPFVGADMDRVASLYPKAVEIAASQGLSFKVLRFDQRTDITQECEAKYG